MYCSISFSNSASTTGASIFFIKPGSVLWFSALGFGARYLAPLFQTTLAWRVLDGLIALVMGSLAVMLLLG
jgi:arginine exporter protein ArgO